MLNAAGKAICAIIIATLAMSLLFTQGVSSQAGADLEAKSMTLLSVVSKLNQTATTAMLHLRRLGNGSEAEQQYALACTFAQKALDAMREGQFSKAILAALEAMQAFQETLRTAESSLNGSSITAGTAERIITQKAAINRTSEYLVKVDGVVSSAQTEGFNVTEIKSVLGETQSRLASATDKLNQLRLDDTAQELALAKVLLDQLAKLQGYLSEQMKIKRATDYLAEAEQRIAILRANITAASINVPKPTQIASLSALNEAEASLSTARTYLNAGLINGTVAELAEFRSEEQRSVSIMQRAGVDLTSQTTDNANTTPNSTLAPGNTPKPGSTSTNATANSTRSTSSTRNAPPP